MYDLVFLFFFKFSKASSKGLYVINNVVTSSGSPIKIVQLT